MVSEHGIEIEVWSNSPIPLNPLGVVVVVLADDSDIGMTQEDAGCSDERGFFLVRPITIKLPIALRSHKRKHKSGRPGFEGTICKGHASDVTSGRFNVVRQWEQISTCRVDEPVAKDSICAGKTRLRLDMWRWSWSPVS